MALKIITMTGYRRPEYTRQVLAALAACEGIGDWLLLANCEPGHTAVADQYRDWSACECHLVVNGRRLGLNINTKEVLMRAWRMKPSQIVHLEDDTVPSPDALTYFSWAIENILDKDVRSVDKHQITLVSGYNKPRKEPTSVEAFATNTRPIWTPWGWGVNYKRLSWLMGVWCTHNPKCFTCKIKSNFRHTRREIFPVLSRIQNIGYDKGENGRTPQWYRDNHRTGWVAGIEQVGAGGFNFA